MRDPGGVGHEVAVLNDSLVYACIEFLQAMDGGSNGKHSAEMLLLRDNLLHRGGSLEWHYELLRHRQVRLEQLLQTRRADLADDPRHYLSERLAIFFLLDDVIFNALSHLDYFANLVHFVITRGSQGKVMWNGLANAALDIKNNKLSQLPVMAAVGSRHKSWIDLLQKYRGRVIHENSTVGGHAPHVDLWGDEPTPSLRVRLWSKLARNLPIQPTVPLAEITPLHAAAAILKSTLGDTLAILQVLRQQVASPGVGGKSLSTS